MYQSLIARPSKDIDIIVDVILQHKSTTTLKFQSGIIFDIGLTTNPSILLIESGRVTMQRKRDDKILLSFEPPFPFGILNTSSISQNYYLSCKSDSVVKILPRDCFFDDVEKKKLWPHVFSLVSYLIDVADEQQNKTLYVDNTYDVIKRCIQDVWNLPENERNNTSLYEYILGRHNISKSSITKVLKSLNDGGYIVTKRAIIKEVRILPKKY